MAVHYRKDELAYYQNIQEEIAADVATVYSYLASNKISEWFPELSFKVINGAEALVFDMGEGEAALAFEILEQRENELIKFQWDEGLVTLSLEATESGSVLTLEEQMPLSQDVEQTANDFVGWYFQMQNIQTISETGDPAELDLVDFMALEAEVLESLENL